MWIINAVTVSPVGRVLCYSIRGPGFESHQWHGNFFSNAICIALLRTWKFVRLLLLVSYITPKFAHLLSQPGFCIVLDGFFVKFWFKIRTIVIISMCAKSTKKRPLLLEEILQYFIFLCQPIFFRKI